MNFLIISHAIHKQQNGGVYAYAPYVREMNLWLNYVDRVEIVAPKASQPLTEIDISYTHKNLSFNAIPSIQFTSLKTSVLSVLKIPIILLVLYKSCKRADHIHLRCPGNIGMLGCFVQIFFPKKQKTAKYAGNWDPKSKQPLSYKLQKWILSNTFLTRNMKVLVYGEWKNQTKNIKPFFTATYSKSEIDTISKRDYKGVLKFVFIGSLVSGKRPLLVVKIIENLHQKGIKVTLNIYGDGSLREEITNYIKVNKLETIINLHGNKTKDEIKKELKTAHFLILPSKSEGWPKAIAEAMFFGVIPIATSISCVPFMLDYGNRGVLIKPSLEEAVLEIKKTIYNIPLLEKISKEASVWSQQFTLDVFQNEIAKLIRKTNKN